MGGVLGGVKLLEELLKALALVYLERKDLEPFVFCPSDLPARIKSDKYGV